jgi:hypothetical protein
MNLAGREPRAADQLVNIDGAWAERADDQLALACADVGEGLRRAFLVGGGKLDGGGRLGRSAQDRRQSLDNVARAGDEAGALLQEIVGAGGTRIEWTAGHSKDLSALLSGKTRRDQGARTLGGLDHHHAE